MPLPPLPDPESFLERLSATARVAPVVGALGSVLLILNGTQVLSLTVLPFSRGAFRAYNRWTANSWWGWCVSATKWLHGVTIELTGDEAPPLENAVVILNHQEMADIVLLMDFARTKDRLGDMKWMVKDSLKYVPGVGWGMLFLDCVFLKRDWASDEESIRRTFARLREDQVPVWLLSFPEGTRLTAEKLEESQRYARDHALPPLRHLIQPRTKGFTAMVEGLRDHVDAVYDVTIGYEGGVPTLWQFIKGFARRNHLHVRRYPIVDLPVGEEALAVWLRERFSEKDELLEHYYEHGTFPRGD